MDVLLGIAVIALLLYLLHRDRVTTQVPLRHGGDEADCDLARVGADLLAGGRSLREV